MFEGCLVTLAYAGPDLRSPFNVLTNLILSATAIFPLFHISFLVHLEQWEKEKEKTI